MSKDVGRLRTGQLEAEDTLEKIFNIAEDEAVGVDCWSPSRGQGFSVAGNVAPAKSAPILERSRVAERTAGLQTEAT